ncbi:MAG: hypothetical protein IKL52_01900 [Candidatus Gastranaerophilales bacterium]|nr:hypothetical protein [Candidatus Gastranaerophilales bacterium]
MRIQPAINLNRSFVNNSCRVCNKNNNSMNQTQRVHGHKYTGVASADLAYVSMFDSAIARDLRLMGLI